MIKLRKSIQFLGLLLLVGGGFSACDITPPPPPACTGPTIINTANYFATDQTLTNHCPNGVDYIIEGTTPYEVLGALTIEAGTSIQFKGNTGLSIEQGAKIIASGTATEPITMEGSTTVSGEWRGIIIYSDDISNKLNYVTISGAGGASFNSNGERGNLVVYADSKIDITNCTFSNSAAYGINSNYESATIRSLMNCQFIGNETPVLVRGNYADVVDATNSFTNNTNSFVHVVITVGIASIQTAKVWQALSIPYRLAGESVFKAQEIDQTTGGLTINAGAVIEFESEVGFSIDDSAYFKAVGTANNRIVFRGASALSGFWDGINISFTQNPLNEIGFVDVEHAGSGDGAVHMWADPVLNVHDTNFKDIKNCVFYDAPKSATDPDNPNLTRTNVTYTNVGTEYCKG